ncbi:MAG: hypothetical protein LBV32_08085, partial [Tannerellaceae bacterium]|nr:hypothetical protein [Tannerellaceae bacterium]
MNLYNSYYKNCLNYRFKIIALFLLLFLSSQHAMSETQKITLSGQNVALKEVFAAIEDQTNLSIDYEESMIDLGFKVTVNIVDQNIGETMNNVLR